MIRNEHPRTLFFDHVSLWITLWISLTIISTHVRKGNQLIIVQYIAATNDRNGNPRRGWKIHRSDGTDGGRYLGYLDEGYAGGMRLSTALAQWATHRNIDLAIEGVTFLPRVNVLPSYWRTESRGRQFVSGSPAVEAALDRATR